VKELVKVRPGADIIMTILKLMVGTSLSAKYWPSVWKVFSNPNTSSRLPLGWSQPCRSNMSPSTGHAFEPHNNQEPFLRNAMRQCTKLSLLHCAKPPDIDLERDCSKIYFYFLAAYNTKSAYPATNRILWKASFSYNRPMARLDTRHRICLWKTAKPPVVEQPPLFSIAGRNMKRLGLSIKYMYSSPSLFPSIQAQ
jgi:hypothetical protein